MALIHSLLSIIVFGLTLYTYLLQKQKRAKQNKFVIPWLKLGFCRMHVIEELMLLYKLRTRGLVFFDELVQQFGTIFKIPCFGLGHRLFVADADIIDKILKSNWQESLGKPQLSLSLAVPDFMRNGLLISPEHIWSHHRKSILPAVKYGPLTKYLKHTTNETHELLLQARSAINLTNGELSNEEMKKIIEHHAVKLITRIVMGDEISSVPENELVHFRESFESAKQALVERLLKPYLLIPLVWWFHPKKPKWDSFSKFIVMFSNKIINKYRMKEAINNSNNDIENSTQCLIEPMIKDGFTDEEISSEVLTFLIAGHDTVVSAIDMLIFHLAYNTQHQKICQDEIDKVLKQKNSTGDFPGISNLNMSDMNDLHHLERCILECLRITPVVPIFIRTLKSPIQIDDNLTLEATEKLIISPWVVHRNPKYYPNPDHFDPDRFLPENVKKRHPCAYIPFSTGKRNCIGWKLAVMEMKVILAGILSCFELRTTDKLSDVKLHLDITIKPERPYNVTFKYRSI